MNGLNNEKAGLTSSNGEEGRPDSKYYLRNAKIHGIMQDVGGMFENQFGNYAMSQALFDLEKVADGDTAAVENSANFYSFDQIRAKGEMAYRRALRNEMSQMELKLIHPAQ
jgi:hypothetical protein